MFTMKTDIDLMKKAVIPVLKRAGVIRSSFFGSYANSDNKLNSDVDILVELPRGKSLFDLADLQMNLDKVLGRKTDVVTFKSLHPLLRDSILSKQVQIL